MFYFFHIPVPRQVHIWSFIPTPFQYRDSTSAQGIHAPLISYYPPYWSQLSLINRALNQLGHDKLEKRLRETGLFFDNNRFLLCVFVHKPVHSNHTNTCATHVLGYVVQHYKPHNTQFLLSNSFEHILKLYILCLLYTQNYKMSLHLRVSAYYYYIVCGCLLDFFAIRVWKIAATAEDWILNPMFSVLWTGCYDLSAMATQCYLFVNNV